MEASYDVVIIGGGLSGAAAAIELAARGRAVLLLEKKSLPAHKLCGEFLSVEVAALFDRLGVLERVERAGACEVHSGRITTASGEQFACALPGTGLGLSRYQLDYLLCRRAAEAGAEVRDDTAVREVQGSLQHGFVVSTNEGEVQARLVLGAYGKRGVLDRKLERDFLQEDAPFVAFKAHYRGQAPAGTVELHGFPGGYCGLSPVEEGRTNVCWIARTETLRADGGSPESMIEQSFQRNPILARRMHRLERVSEQFLAVSQVYLKRKAPFDGEVCMIGDAAGMIAPLCGDGMAMALTSAKMAVPLVERFLDGTWEEREFRRRYAAQWRGRFGLRMRLGRWLHHLYLHPEVAHWAVRACRWVPPLGRWLVQQTRGASDGLRKEKNVVFPENPTVHRGTPR